MVIRIPQEVSGKQQHPQSPEAAKIVLLSVTEGEDKPLKYPGIVHRWSQMLRTKIDPLPRVDFDPKLALENARKIHPRRASR